MDKPLRVVVVEDEEPLRTWLCDRLNEFKDVEVAAQTGSVSAAFKLILQTRPDGLFLDIKLIGGDAFQLLQQMKDNNVPIPPIIMVTAFDEYAPDVINKWGNYVKRYLRKPFVENWEAKLRDCINALLTANQAFYPPTTEKKKEEDIIVVSDGKFIYRINSDDLIWIEVAGGGAIYLVTENLQVKLDSTLKSFVEQRPPNFKRISRDVVVNFDKVIRIDREDRGVILTYQSKEKFLGIGNSYYRGLLEELKY